MLGSFILRVEEHKALSTISELRAKYENVEGMEEFIKLLNDQEETIKSNKTSGTLTLEVLKSVNEIIDAKRPYEEPSAEVEEMVGDSVSTEESSANDAKAESYTSEFKKRLAMGAVTPETHSDDHLEKAVGEEDSDSTDPSPANDVEPKISTAEFKKRLIKAMNTPEKHHEVYPIYYEEDDESEPEASGNSNDYTYESSESYSSDCEQESNTENQEPEEVYAPNLVKEISLSIYLPTNLPKDYYGKLDIDGKRGSFATKCINHAIDKNVFLKRNANKRRLIFNFNFPYTDKINGVGKMYTNVLAPAEVDDEGDAWFYVNVSFKQAIDKNNIPDEVLERIAYWMKESIRDYGLYMLTHDINWSFTDGFVFGLIIDDDRLDDLDFLRSRINKC